MCDQEYTEENGKTIYGPVPSWRYGLSLGIDLTPGPKRCTFNCLYCQLGPTKRPVRDPFTIQSKLPTVERVLDDLDVYLTRIDSQSLDVVTFSGSGEPTLNLRLGAVAKQLQTRLVKLPQVLLTNGTLLLQPQVLNGLSKLDIVTVKFDAGDDDTLLEINRPTLPFRHTELVAGIQALRAQTQVTIALEVMLLQTTTGISNTAGQARTHLLSALKRIAPHVDLIQLYTPWRPPSDSTVEALSKQALLNFRQELSAEVGKEKLWVYGIHDARGKAAAWKVHKSLREELLTVLARRPSRISDLTLTLGIPFHRILAELKNLQRAGEVNLQRYKGEMYYFHQEKG